MKSGLVMLCSDSETSRIIYHGLRSSFSDLTVIIEQSVSRRKLLRRRMRTLGPLTVAGQIAFLTLVVPLLRISARGRIKELKRVHGLSDEPIDCEKMYRVSSANAPEARALLANLSPSIVVINGTRLLSESTLQSAGCRFVNMHHGITPAYRGVHGGYWALAEGEPSAVGTTIHYVDRGIDTGSALRYVYFPVRKKDNFTTYPLLHVAYGLPVLIQLLRDLLAGAPTTEELLHSGKSKLRTHPTLCEYLRYRRAFGAC